MIITNLVYLEQSCVTHNRGKLYANGWTFLIIQPLLLLWALFTLQVQRNWLRCTVSWVS